MSVYINPVFQDLPSPEREKEAVTELELLAQDIATTLSRIAQSHDPELMLKAISLCNNIFPASYIQRNLEAMLNNREVIEHE